MNTEKLSARARIRIRSAPSDVFAAFANAANMSKFWFARSDDGLQQGKASTWSLGSGANAFSFDVNVKEVRKPEKIRIEWEGPDGNLTQVVWLFEGTDDGETILTIEESGFSGSADDIVKRVADSTGGFNQVIVAAKALIEHGVAVNVVTDHA